MLEKSPEHCIVSYIVLFAKTGYVDEEPLCAWITKQGNQITGNVMDHAILSIVIAYCAINDCMQLYDQIRNFCDWTMSD